MGFWNALSVLAPVAPALSDAQDIRLARQQEAQELAQKAAAFPKEQALRDAQLTTQKLAAQYEQQRLRAASQPMFKEGSQPVFNPVSGTFQQPAWDDKKQAYVPIDVWGVTPEEQEKYQLESFKKNRAAAQALLPNESPETWDYLGYTLGGMKPPPATKFTALPGAQGQAQEYPKGSGNYVVFGRDAEGRIVANPVPPGYTPPTPKPLPISTEYVQVMGKDPSTWTAQDRQFVKGYGAYLKAQEALAGARGSAFNASRPVQVFDPNDPSRAYVVPAGVAERDQLPTIQSTTYKVNQATQSALNRYFTSGKGAENIRTLNTAVSHLALLRQLSSALDNGDIRLWNAGRQAYNRATGVAAPVNFDMLRDSLAGEMARVFTGVGATQQEIAEITGPISSSNSPAQLTGAIDTAQAAMNSRLRALKEQYAAGKQGQPAFQGAGGAGTGGGTAPVTPARPAPSASPANPLGLNLPGLPSTGAP